ncbi:FAD/NAD(P)-binding domain-containing protein [Clavulina sp. PMI_390]|nr:FAD/NAD(P)-binding domain-containing protein [Clavulina sp. PMI_390]
MLIAVVGCGVSGLTAIKNCLEEFGGEADVVAFERESCLGGLWNYRPDDLTVTSVMENTKTNFCKHRMGFTDFPFPDDAPLWLPASSMAKHLNDYAEHFNLLPNITFNTVVTRVDFAPTSDPNTVKFEVTHKSRLSGEESSVIVDRVVIASGALSQPDIPNIPGIEHFTGTVSHTSGFRNGIPFKGKNVLVVGSRTSAADTCALLDSGDASKIYMSHRGGVQLIPRNWNGKPIDHLLTRRLANLQALMEKVWPYSSGHLHNIVVNVVRSTTFKYKKEWKFTPTPDTRSSVPTITDDLYDLLASGRVEPVSGISHINPDSSITLSDGRELSSIDAIIFATGYSLDFGTAVPFSQAILDRMGYDPQTPDTIPRYRYTLSVGLPELCVLTQMFAPSGYPLMADIRAMWLAGVWSGNVKLPTDKNMLRVSKQEEKWVKGLQKFGDATPGSMPIEILFLMAVEAGCEDDHMFWFGSWAGWKWWWNHRALTSLLLDGPDIPASHRLRGRKKWDGAEDAIWKANGKVPPQRTKK